MSTARQQHMIYSHSGRVTWLGECRLFQELWSNSEALAHFAHHMDVRHIPTGSYVFREGEPGHDAYFLAEGTVQVLKTIAGGETFPMARLSAANHAFFGESALLQPANRSASLLVEAESTCLVINKVAFDKACQSHPDWALPVVVRIARGVVDRLHKANDDIVLLYNALVDEVKGWNP